MITQIYEIQTPQEAEKCIELGVDHMGSVLLSQYIWRIPSIKEVIRLSDGAGTKNCLIPLFQDTGILYKALDYYHPHFVHFCDAITDHNCPTNMDRLIQFQSNLKEKFPEIGIIRTIPISRAGVLPPFSTLKIAQLFEPVSDIFLTDTWLGNEPVEGYIGITGKTADRSIARDLVVQSDIPVILAGGLYSENVYDAIMEVLPAGADSCTRTNKVDDDGRPLRFEKDFQKVKRFVKEIRRAEKEIARISHLPS